MWFEILNSFYAQSQHEKNSAYIKIVDFSASIIGISNSVFNLKEGNSGPIRVVDEHSFLDETFFFLKTADSPSCNIFFKPVNNSWNHSLLPDVPPPLGSYN